MAPRRLLTRAAAAVVAAIGLFSNNGPSTSVSAATCTAAPFTILPADYGLDYCVGNNLDKILELLAVATKECPLLDIIALQSSTTITSIVDLVTKMVAAPDQISVLFYQHMKATTATQMDSFCSTLNTVISPCAKSLLPDLLPIFQSDLTCCSQISDILDLLNLAVPSNVSKNSFLLNEAVNGVNSFFCSKRDATQTCGTSIYSQLTTKFTQAQFSVIDSFLMPFFTASAGQECNAMSGKDYTDSANLATARTIDYGCCTHQIRPLLETVQNAFAYLLGSTVEQFLNGVVEFASTTTKFVNAVPGTTTCTFASKCTNPSYMIPQFTKTIAPGTNKPGKNSLVDVTCTKVQKCDAAGTTCSEVCQKGTASVSTWLNQTLAYQRKLTYKGPICYAQIPSTHNSAITLADGFGNRDQLFNLNLNPLKAYSYLKTNNHALSLTDQLQLGVRWLEVDAHYFLDDLHTAHCGNLGSASITALFGAIDAKLAKYGTILWGPELLGCFPSVSGIRPEEQPKTRDTFLELRAWLDKPENQKEPLFLYLDTGSELSRLSKLTDLNALLVDVFGDLIVPMASINALAASKWTNGTIQDFIDKNQRVFVLANSNTGVAYSLTDFCGGHKILDTKFINTLPDASRSIGGIAIYSSNYFVRSYQSVLRYISLGEAGTITQVLPTTLDSGNLANFVRWNLNLVATDMVDGARMKAQAWSWAENEPSTTSSSAVAFINTSGRWIASATAAKTWKACWNGTTLKWSIVAYTAACATGFTFTAPQDAYQNYLLQAEVTAQKITIPVAINASLV
ncbi:hypothetical protein FI667_g4450, partial [Globisporangium splendens]